MKRIIILFIFILNSGWANTQNLVRNGGFEDYKSCITDREAAVNDAAPWYIAGGTPDAYQFKCNNPDLFESMVHTPYHGDVFLAIGGAPFKGGSYYSEAIGIELTEPLKAGKKYLLELKARSFRFNGVDNVPPYNQCPVTPSQYFNVYLSQDSFKVNHEFQGIDLLDSYANGHIAYKTNANRIIPTYDEDNVNFFTNQREVPWESLVVCLEAKGNERFLGITLQTGEYEVEPDCQDLGTFFPVHYINLDDIRLMKFPDEMHITIPICIDEKNEVRLREYMPGYFRTSDFIWSDGRMEDTRNVYQEGVETIDLVLPCDTIPLYVTFEGEDCKTYVNVPTAFSPNNFDGINDEIKPFIRNYWEITNYEYQIYNRWGQLLFKTNDYHLGWNGQVNGEMMGEGVYVWMIKYDQNEDGETKSYLKSGNFTLMK